MNPIIEARHGDAAWRDLLGTILTFGRAVAPRGQKTLEVLHTNNIVIDMSRPVVTSPVRKLNYRFMAAEALWILSGSNELAPLQRFIKTYDRFSDDGKTLFGAYGPRIMPQLDYVVKTLLTDRDTRQAVLTIWRESPPASKDIPCTVAMSFSIRDGRLYQHVFMRSSDAWLGVPYDMFSFACVGLRIGCLYNQRRDALRRQDPVVPGVLTISMTSSHLYETNFEAARTLLASTDGPAVEPVTWRCVDSDWYDIERSLIIMRDTVSVDNGTAWKCAL
jgi:thymidylate synthase